MTVIGLLDRCLRAAGATQAFRAAADWPSLPDLPERTVADASLASLLADAAGRLGPGPGVALLEGRRMRLSSLVGGEATELVVSEPDELPLAVAAWSAGRVHAAVELSLHLDLEAPAPAGVEPVALSSVTRPLALAPDLQAEAVVVLAGPGVLRSGAVADLAHVAHHGGLGVVNTWGAKGVFRWDDPAHFGTAGLQARDFELAGVTGAPLVIAVGIDEDESPRERWATGPVLDIEPSQLAALVSRWPEAASMPPRPALYTELSAALAPLYDPAAPANPAQAAARLAEALPSGGLVAADPGPVGLWIARCLPTREPGSVVVPATVAPGTAVAVAVVGAAVGRPSVAVTGWPLDPISEALAELGRSWGSPCAVVAWDPALAGSEAPGAEELAERFASEGGRVLRLGVDPTDTSVLEAVAGPVVAWQP